VPLSHLLGKIRHRCRGWVSSYSWLVPRTGGIGILRKVSPAKYLRRNRIKEGKGVEVKSRRKSGRSHSLRSKN